MKCNSGIPTGSPEDPRLIEGAAVAEATSMMDAPSVTVRPMKLSSDGLSNTGRSSILQSGLIWTDCCGLASCMGGIMLLPLTLKWSRTYRTEGSKGQQRSQIYGRVQVVSERRTALYRVIRSQRTLLPICTYPRVVCVFHTVYDRASGKR